MSPDTDSTVGALPLARAEIITDGFTIHSYSVSDFLPGTSVPFWAFLDVEVRCS